MHVSRNALAASLMFLGLVSATGHAHGATIIDTGGRPNPNPIGSTLDSDQWLAGRITLTQAYTITGVEMWLHSIFTGNMFVSIYSDDAGTPDPAPPLFEINYNAPATTPTGADWVGPQGLSWDLGPGSFWVVFGVNSPDSTWYAAPDSAPNPLSSYAVTSDSAQSWNVISSLGMGFRVYGEPQPTAVVPEPATLTLLGLGLGGLAARRLRRRH